MKLKELDLYFTELLNIDAFAAQDLSQNGVQVQNSGKEIKKVAFAVDACLQSIKEAAERKADMLFVHHGLFWSRSLRIMGNHYGNNIGLARRLELENLKEFGMYRGLNIGFYGSLPLKEDSEEGLEIDEIINKLFPQGEKPANILPFGPKKIKTIGIISGGAASEIDDAIALGLDLYITGEIEHITYHNALENRINVIAGGHYQTETVGVQLVAKKLELDTNLETCFIDIPTGF